MEFDAIDVWFISCDGVYDPGVYDTLSDGERERADAFVFPEHRRRFIQGHACLRQILHRYTGVSPGALQFGYGENGKPFLNNGNSHLLSFNLSHSGELAVVAVGGISEIGVDIEQIRSLQDWEEIANGTFHPAETQWVRAAVGGPTEAFFQVWTAKEAYIKASGRGLAHPLDSIAVVGTPPQREYVITWLKTPHGYAGAVAHPPPVRIIRQGWWRGDERAGREGF